MDKAVAILNTIADVNDYTMFKVLNKLHKLESRVAFIIMRPERRKG